jgi:hypothetical protein
MTAVAQWWTGQPGLVRWPMYALAAVLVLAWLEVARLYRPRRRPAARQVWAGATEGWSPMASTTAAGPSEDMTAAAVEHARDVDALVRVEVAERLDLEHRQAEHAAAEAGTDWAMAVIDLDRRLDRTLSAFATQTGRILSAWPDTAQWPVVVPVADRPVRPATGKRARRDRKRVHQGKAVAA